MTTHIFHHNDLDGRCSAFLVKEHVEFMEVFQGNKPQIIFYESDYSKQFPLDENGAPIGIAPHDDVWIVDFSIHPDEYRCLEYGHTGRIVWIDHHKTAIEKYAKEFTPEGLEKIEGIREEGEASAALLVWRFLYPEKQAPTFVAYTSDWDTWQFKMSLTRHFKYGMDAEDTNPVSDIWVRLLSSEVYGAGETLKTIIENGEVIITYNKQRSMEILKACAHAGFVHGYHVLFCNAPLTNSELFDSRKENYEIFSPYYFNGKKWVVSLYRNPKFDYFDVSEIAKQFGGGGHPSAAGFTCDVLPSEWGA